MSDETDYVHLSSIAINDVKNLKRSLCEGVELSLVLAFKCVFGGVMIPGKFEYHAPNTVQQALALLYRFQGGAKILAGGQSLVPLMRRRLIKPAHLIDIGCIDELRTIDIEADTLKIGAAVCDSDIASSEKLKEMCPLLPDVSSRIADPQTRNKATIGGNIMSAIPSNDHPAVLLTLEAILVFSSLEGNREVFINKFLCDSAFVLKPDEILTHIILPIMPKHMGYSYQKFTHLRGGRCRLSVALTAEPHKTKNITVAFAISNTETQAFKSVDIEALLSNAQITRKTIDEAKDLVIEQYMPVSQSCNRTEYVSSDYNKQIASYLFEKALLSALSTIHYDIL